MILQNQWNASESYTHDRWEYRDVYVGFSRLYYILDGEAYYEEDGTKIRLKKHYLYLTPVKKSFTLTENPENKLLHTFTHITTLPPVDHLMELEVRPGTPLADAVALWRKYIHSEDHSLLSDVIQFLLSCIDRTYAKKDSVAVKTKMWIDKMEDFSFSMNQLCADLGYRREHITRSFFSAYRLTPKQYFNIQKMNRALEKLKNGARVYEVAYDLGYSSSYAFSKAFKKHFGLSPEKYLVTLK